MKLSHSSFPLLDDFSDFVDLEMFPDVPCMSSAHTDQTVPTATVTTVQPDREHVDDNYHTMLDYHNQFSTTNVTDTHLVDDNQMVPIFQESNAYETPSTLQGFEIPGSNTTRLMTDIEVVTQPQTTLETSNPEQGRNLKESAETKSKPATSSPKSTRKSTKSPNLAESQRRRKKANEREKQRIVILKEALNVLKNTIPAARKKPKLTKLEILHLARDYIKSLKLQLHESEDCRQVDEIKVKIPVKTPETVFTDDQGLFVYCNYDSQHERIKHTTGDLWLS